MINYDKFQSVCAMTKQEILEEGIRLGGKVTEHKEGEVYLHIDRGSPVLGIAHMDYRYEKSFHFHKIDVEGIPYVLCPRLDDRIGIYTLFYHLPELGINYDILITDFEEDGKSTGEYFKSERQYNWMFQFDRRNEDVVHYMYDTDFLLKRLKRAGFKGVNKGIASDISKMEHMKCCGFNVGTGYKDEHSLWAMADMSMFERQVERFVDFYQKFNGLWFKYEKKTYTYKSWKSSEYTLDRGTLPMPPEGRTTWANGFYWSSHHMCFMPYNRTQETVTSDVEEPVTCIACLSRITSENQGVKFTNVCTKCEPLFFLCIGCNMGHRVSLQREKDLCDSCSTLAQQSGSRDFLTSAVCSEPGCNTLLTYEEYKNGGICERCTTPWYY